MTQPKPRPLKSGTYRVKWSDQQLANGVDTAQRVFRQGHRQWFAGDMYDGDAPAEPLRRGWLEEVPGG